MCYRSRMSNKKLASLKEERQKLLPKPTKSDAEYFGGGSIQGDGKIYQAPDAGAKKTSGDSRPLPPRTNGKVPPAPIVLGPAHVRGAAPPPTSSTAAREKDPPMELSLPHLERARLAPMATRRCMLVRGPEGLRLETLYEHKQQRISKKFIWPFGPPAY